jgi:hypothetical protein
MTEITPAGFLTTMTVLTLLVLGGITWMAR